MTYHRSNIMKGSWIWTPIQTFLEFQVLPLIPVIVNITIFWGSRMTATY